MRMNGGERRCEGARARRVWAGFCGLTHLSEGDDQALITSHLNVCSQCLREALQVK